MSFQWASLLWLLVLLPMLVLFYLWAQRRRRKYAARYASILLVKDALGRGPGFKRHVPALLFLAGLSAGIVGLARPQATVILPSSSGTVILVMDISGSMRAQDLAPNRFEAAKAAAKAFIAGQSRSVRIGIVAFSATAALVQPPTTSRDDLNASLDRLRTQRGTAVGSGILTALNAIFESDPKAQPLPADRDFGGFGGRFGWRGYGEPGSGGPGGAPFPPAAPDQPLTNTPEGATSAPVAPGSYASAAVVLLSDGQTNTGPNPLDAADEAANRGVRVFTVGVGTTSGDVVGAEGRYFRVALDEEALKKIAQNTAASYYKAGSTEDLLNIYKTLSVRLTMGREHTEITAPVLAAALLLFVTAAALSLIWFNRATL